jgi:hypothetical protein
MFDWFASPHLKSSLVFDPRRRLTLETSSKHTSTLKPTISSPLKPCTLSIPTRKNKHGPFFDSEPVAPLLMNTTFQRFWADALASPFVVGLKTIQMSMGQQSMKQKLFVLISQLKQPSVPEPSSTPLSLATTHEAMSKGVYSQ